MFVIAFAINKVTRCRIRLIVFRCKHKQESDDNKQIEKKQWESLEETIGKQKFRALSQLIVEGTGGGNECKKRLINEKRWLSVKSCHGHERLGNASNKSFMNLGDSVYSFSYFLFIHMIMLLVKHQAINPWVRMTLEIGSSKEFDMPLIKKTEPNQIHE